MDGATYGIVSTWLTCILIDRMQQVLDTHRLPGIALELEITENVFLHPGKVPSQILTALKDRGVRIAIDDFGTGFSSLTYLLSLPFDTLKIDRSFVENIETDPVKKGILQGILVIANSLAVQCVVEEVESISQLKCLQQLGYYSFQGHYFHPPVMFDQLLPLLDQSFQGYGGLNQGCRPNSLQ